MSDGLRRIIYPGTFDPITLGHIDVVGRAVQLFDEVVLAIAADSTKRPLFTLEERQTMATEALARFGPKVRVTAFHGLLIDYVLKENSRAILRGLRAISDFEFEFQMALMNRKLNDSIETLFLMPRGAYTYLSSSIIKEIGRLGGDVTAFVPAPVVKALHEKFHGAKP